MSEINPLINNQIFLKKIAENTGSDYDTGDVSEINPLTIDQILLKEIAANTAGQSGDITELEEKVTANAEAIEAIVDVYGAKNIIPFPYISTFPVSFAQVTATCDKGKVTLNSTAGSDDIFTVVLVAKSSSVFNEASNALPIFTHDGTYIISNGTNVRIQMNIYRNGSKINTIICTDTEIQFDALSTDTVEIGIAINKGETFNNTTCYPMIRDARLTPTGYVPYAMTNRELTERTNGYGVSITPESGYTVTANRLKVVNGVLVGHLSISKPTNFNTMQWETVATANIRPSADLVVPLYSESNGMSGGVMTIGTQGNVGVFQSFYDPTGSHAKDGVSGTFSNPI